MGFQDKLTINFPEPRMILKSFNKTFGAMAIPAFAALALLAACGGSGSSPTPAAPVPTSLTPGYYATTTATGEGVVALYLSDGTFWFSSYSPDAVPGDTVPVSLIGGTLTAASGNLAFSGRRFSLPKAIPSDGLVSGTGSWGPTSMNLTLFNSDPAGGSSSQSANYALALEPQTAGSAALATVTGAYQGILAIQDQGSGAQSNPAQAFTVTASGGLAGTFPSSTAGGPPSTIAGTITPRTDSNCYDLTFTITAPAGTTGNSSLDGMTFTGVAGYDSSHKVLLILALNGSAVTPGVFPVIFAGSRS